MKQISGFVLTLALLLATTVSSFAAVQPIRGTEGPDTRARIESKGTEGPDTRATLQPKGTEGPDWRATIQPKGTEGPDIR